jgi:hypothetical protein
MLRIDRSRTYWGVAVAVADFQQTCSCPQKSQNRSGGNGGPVCSRSSSVLARIEEAWIVLSLNELNPIMVIFGDELK